jgi:hypothetical protein
VKSYLYLSLLPESLVASMLPPEEFGAYMATGTRKEPHGKAMFFQVRPDLLGSSFDLGDVDKLCVPHADGQPKHSVYLSVYRVLERVPLSALGSLWLITRHGRAMEIKQSAAPSGPKAKFHLYRELSPVQVVVASSQEPLEFSKFITDPARRVSVPRICFVEFALGGLANDPTHGSAADLPYHNIGHIRNCLAELGPKQTKTVDRVPMREILYRCVDGGFFVGDQQGTVYYPYPSLDELEGKYHSWWRSANDVASVD